MNYIIFILNFSLLCSTVLAIEIDIQDNPHTAFQTLNTVIEGIQAEHRKNAAVYFANHMVHIGSGLALLYAMYDKIGMPNQTRETVFPDQQDQSVLFNRVSFCLLGLILIATNVCMIGFTRWQKNTVLERLNICKQ